MTRRYYYRPWKDETLISALHFLRCRIIRDGEEGQEHADALLRSMGVDPDTLPLPRKVKHHYKRGELQRAILGALRTGPLTGAQIAELVQGDLDPKAAYKRTYQALSRLRKAGLLVNNEGLWAVAPHEKEGDP